MKHRHIFVAIISLLSSVTYCMAEGQIRQIIHPEIRTAQPSPVYDFIERYFSEIESSKDAEVLRLKMKDDKVEVLEGSLSAIRNISTTTPFSLNRMGDSFYQMSWTEGNKSFLTFRFPVNFELLLGQSKAQIEKKMKEMISSSTTAIPAAIGSEQEYEHMDDGCYKTKPSLFYQLESFNDARYYNKADSAYVPVFDESHNWYSAANLMQGVIAPDDRRMYIEQNLYGGEKTTYTVSLSNWLNYCAVNKLKIYFCIEEEREDGLKALLIAHSNELNYNHMIQLIIPDNFIEKKNCVVKATLNAFIPTQNVKDLYKKYSARTKKKI